MQENSKSIYKITKHILKENGLYLLFPRSPKVGLDIEAVMDQLKEELAKSDEEKTIKSFIKKVFSVLFDDGRGDGHNQQRTIHPIRKRGGSIVGSIG